MRRILRSAVVLMLLLIVASACAPAAGGSPSTGSGRIEGLAVAGPTCPVVTDPPQSGCDARPVAGARLVIVDSAGTAIATLTTGQDGTFEVNVAPGRYEVRARPVEGLMGTAPPVSVTVGRGDDASVTISYDTGIR